MKTKYWILLLVILFIFFIILSIFFFRDHGSCKYAEIWSDEKLFQVIDLNIAQSFTVESRYGTNTITVENGKIAVTEASCPDHYCMKRGQCSSGPDIICLPNHLIIKFTNTGTLDASVG